MPPCERTARPNGTPQIIAITMQVATEDIIYIFVLSEKNLALSKSPVLFAFCVFREFLKAYSPHTKQMKMERNAPKRYSG